ncbi:hypothetical protein ZWY2020_040264 [Hordeum vulgare]|nr:hypothetical protein ZWY2020_040264 [Hordeum vulgare]
MASPTPCHLDSSAVSRTLAHAHEGLPDLTVLGRHLKSPCKTHAVLVLSPAAPLPPPLQRSTSPPPSVAAAPDLPKQVRPAAQDKKGRPQHHHASAADKEAAKKHHHLDLNTLRGHTDCVTALDFSSDACNLTTGIVEQIWSP